jgi:hypothetical protein
MCTGVTFSLSLTVYDDDDDDDDNNYNNNNNNDKNNIFNSNKKNLTIKTKIIVKIRLRKFKEIRNFV